MPWWSREDYGTRSFGCWIKNCVCLKLEVEECGVCPPPPSQLQPESFYEETQDEDYYYGDD